MINKVFFISSLCFLFALQVKAQDVSFSIQAHEDDWQLFMSSKIIADLNANGKVVFITLTAGDAGNGDGSYSPGGPFYLSRENGSVYSSKFAADITNAATPSPAPTGTVVVVNSHNINKYVYGNTVNYFLRLPDGGQDGDGFPITGNKSLQKLRLGSITSLSAVDNSATYTSWTDLKNTILQIINNERGADPQIWIYTADLDNLVNPSDHSDHLHAAMAAQEVVNSLLWVGIAVFVDYASSGMPANLSDYDHENAAAVFNLSEWGITEKQYASNFDAGHKSWLPMDYFVVKRSPVGNAPFTILEPGKSSGEQKYTIIPMIASITAPVSVDNELKMLISPYETGSLTTKILNEKGETIYTLQSTIKKRDPLLINIGKIFSQKGKYKLTNVLNNKFMESRSIIVE